MGKKGGWFAAVKRVWISDSKKKDKEEQSGGDEKEKKGSLDSQDAETVLAKAPIPFIPLPETVTSAVADDDDDEQSRHAYSVAFATAVAAEAAVAAAQAAAEVVRLTRTSRKSKEEIAAIKLQSAFRGYMARRAVRLIRLKSRIGERSVKQQAITTLKCMQTIAKLQAEVRARRARMLEENRAVQKQLQQKREKELEKPKTPHPGGKFDVSTRTKEQIKAKIENRQEAAKRRERALTYAYTHQMTRRNSLKSTNQTFMDPYNPQWGWSWLERWMASRPWDDRIAVIKELGSNNDPETIKTTPKVNANSSRDKDLPVKTTTKVNNDTNKHSATPQKQNFQPTTPQSPSNIATTMPAENDDPRRKITENENSEHHSRRHSIEEGIVREYGDEKKGRAEQGSSRGRSFMAPTESTKARSRMAGKPLLYLEKRYGTPENNGNNKMCSNGVPRRHSAPPAIH